MRRFRAEGEPEPWIEQLVQSYGTERERELSVRAHVVGVSELTESQRTDDSDACMLFLSDGTVFIPAVLSAAAWERMQELEERDTFSSLDNSTVSVRKFQLNFHMDPELTTCQFYLTVHQIVSVGRVSRHPRPPSWQDHAFPLHKSYILHTRFCKEVKMFLIILLFSFSTMLLSVRQQILKTWRSLMKENSVTSLASQSQSAFPLSCLMGAWHNDIIMDLLNDAIKKIGTHTEGHLRMATPTHWHQERLRCRDEPCFSTPVSHLLIPEEQREMLTADPGVSGSSETQSGLLPPETIERPITVQDWGGDSLSVISDRPEDARQITLNNTRAEAWCVTGGGGGEGGGGERESPWDMFCPAADLLVTPSSASESSLESLSHMDSRSLLATGSLEESTVVVPPFQRPRPSPRSPTQPSDPTTTDLQEQPQTPPSPLTSSEPTAIMGVEEQSPIDAGQKTPHPHPHQVSPTPPTKKRNVHSDGSSFSYTYEPCPIIASAFSRYKVPEQLVQWAVAYQGTPQQTPIVSSGVELKDVAVKK